MKRKKRGIRKAACALAIVLLLGNVSLVSRAEDGAADVTVTASENAGTEAADTGSIDTTLSAASEEATDQAYNMKIDSNQLPGWPQGPQTYGEAGIIIDADSGAVLYAKNIDGKAYPASITKILTMLVALENAEPDQKVTFTQESIDCLLAGYAHIGMLPGEELTLTDALYALMLASANEVAYAIGESEGEGYDWFLNKMNEKAREVGAVHSNFVNPNGIFDENHYTTARDMALITQDLFLNHQEFQDVCQTLQYTIEPTNLEKEQRIFQQKHQMFYSSSDNYYEYAVAGKTGYTDEALNTLVTCADNGDLRLICVVLKTHGRHVYTDTRALFDYGYSQFHKVNVSELESSEDIGSMEEDAYVVLPDGVELSSLEKEIIQDEENKRNGVISYTYQGNPVGNVSIRFSDKYLAKHSPQVLESEKEEAEKTKKESGSKEELSAMKWVVFAGVAVLILLLIRYLTVLNIRRKKRRKLERKRRRLQRYREENGREQQMQRRRKR